MSVAQASNQALAAARLMFTRLHNLIVRSPQTSMHLFGWESAFIGGPAIVREMGYGKTRSLTALGDTVNIASRLRPPAGGRGRPNRTRRGAASLEGQVYGFLSGRRHRWARWLLGIKLTGPDIEPAFQHSPQSLRANSPARRDQERSPIGRVFPRRTGG